MSRIIIILLAVGALAPGGQRLPVKCTQNLHERGGQGGYTILASRPLAGSTAQPLYWHFGRFDTLLALTVSRLTQRLRHVEQQIKTPRQRR